MTTFICIRQTAKDKKTLAYLNPIVLPVNISSDKNRAGCMGPPMNVSCQTRARVLSAGYCARIEKAGKPQHQGQLHNKTAFGGRNKVLLNLGEGHETFSLVCEKRLTLKILYNLDQMLTIQCYFSRVSSFIM